MNTVELYHHGILGMKWGHRNGPPYPLDAGDHSASEQKAGWRKSLDNDGSASTRKKYDVDKEGAQKRLEKAKADYKTASRNYNKETHGGMTIASKETTRALLNASQEQKWAKDDVKDEKIKEKLNTETGEKSKHRQKLEAEYREKGMTEEEAAIAAYKRERTEKILIAAGAVAATAAVAYVGYKQYDKYVDKLIPAGTTLQNISRNSNKGVSDAFYAAFNKGDMTKYRGIYGGEQLGGLYGADIFRTNIGVSDNLKVASPKNASKILKDLVGSDPDYAKKLEQILTVHIGQYPNDAQNKVIREALTELKSGKIGTKTFEGANLLLTNHTPVGQELSDKLYDRLKSAGYDAIMDVNDRRRGLIGKSDSGYQSANPVIVFNGAKTFVDSIEQLSTSSMAKDNAAASRDLAARSFIEQLAPVTAGYAGLGAAAAAGTSAIQSKANDKVVAEYHKEHPDSDKSYKDIVREHNRK